MDERARQIIQIVGELPPLPQAAQKALAITYDPKSNMADIAHVLIMDQILVSMVLRSANSAHYGLANPVTTVQQAVVYLGYYTVQRIVLKASLVSIVSRPLPGYELEREGLWRHSIGVATGARLLAQKTGYADPEEAYHAGLLADIGKLAFEILLRDVNPDSEKWEGRSFADFEASKFGVDHAALGAELVRKWNLSEALLSAIANHHHPGKAGEFSRLAAIVHIADAMVMMMGIGIGKDGLKYSLDPDAFQLSHSTAEQCAAIMDQISDSVKVSEDLLELPRMK